MGEIGVFISDVDEAQQLVDRIGRLRRDFNGCLPSSLLHLIEGQIRAFEAEQLNAEEYAEALRDDAKFDLFCERRFRIPYTRASSYSRVEPDQELHCVRALAFSFDANDPRRPVAMRGSRARRISLGTLGYYYTQIARRYLRRIKYTCFDPKLNRENIERLEHRLVRKYGLRKLDLHKFEIYWEPASRASEWGVASNASVWVNGARHVFQHGGQAQPKEPSPPPNRPEVLQAPRTRSERREQIAVAALRELGIEI